MLTAIEVLELQTTKPILSLALSGAVGSEAIQVKNVEGLDPVKASITTTPLGTFNGESFLGSSVGKRNIVFTMGLNPDWATQTVAELRKQLYEYFMPQLPLRLRFISTHLPNCQIVGYVESMTANIFAKEPEYQVSVLCPEPDFVAVDSTDLVGAPGSSPRTYTLNYEGSAPAGFNLQIRTSGSGGPPALIIVQNETYSEQIFMVTAQLDVGTKFELNSVPGNKYVRDVNLSSGTPTNRAYSITPESDWPLIFPGENDLTFVTVYDPTTWALSYFARFGGL